MNKNTGRPGKLRVVLVKPSKYTPEGHVERYRWGFMPNSTPIYIASLTPKEVEGIPVEVCLVDEYVHTNLDYLKHLHSEPGVRTLMALVGVQSHQLQRGLDLAAYAREHGVGCTVIGGPHVMTCDTTSFQGKGLSVALSEAESVWYEILRDAAIEGELKTVYGADTRWVKQIDAPVLMAPPKDYLSRALGRAMGIHPVRGCPYTCNFCSVIMISGRNMRSQSVDSVIASLKVAKAAGVRQIFFTSDNFNKYPEGGELLRAMIEEKIDLPFGCQCDVQVGKQPELIELLRRAGCRQIFLGVESFSRSTLRAASKPQNDPQIYGTIVKQCQDAGIEAHFSNIIGFPDDTKESVYEHMEMLQDLGPQYASFYLLTPIPGTEQYDDFLAKGLITENNLDRFDASCHTWNHPNLSRDDFYELLWWAYHEFYGLGDALKKNLYAWRGRSFTEGSAFFVRSLGYAAFQRVSAYKGVHPNQGGIVTKHVDHVDDYIDLRRKMYGFSLAPLPESLKLSAEDEAFNSKAKITPIDASMPGESLIATSG